jgi:hypothetical protein
LLMLMFTFFVECFFLIEKEKRKYSIVDLYTII